MVNLLILSSLFLGLFLIAEILYHKFSFNGEKTRKIVHIGTGLLTLLFPVLLDNNYEVIILCSSFMLMLLSSFKFNLLRSINDIDRFSLGSILYPVIVVICFYFYNQSDELVLFYLPILILAICDPIAATVGINYPFGRVKVWGGNKTISGGCGFAISSFILSFFLLIAFDSTHSLTIAILLSFITTISEFISGNGLDNLTIPLSSLLVLQF